jgi:hypothetical protein
MAKKLSKNTPKKKLQNGGRYNTFTDILGNQEQETLGKKTKSLDDIRMERLTKIKPKSITSKPTPSIPVNPPGPVTVRGVNPYAGIPTDFYNLMGEDVESYQSQNFNINNPSYVAAPATSNAPLMKFPYLGIKPVPDFSSYVGTNSPKNTITSGQSSYPPGTFDLNTPFSSYASEFDADPSQFGVQQGPITKSRAEELGYKESEENIAKNKKRNQFENIKPHDVLQLGLYGVNAMLRKNEAMRNQEAFNRRFRNVMTQKPLYDYNYLYGPDASGGTQYQNLIMAQDGAEIRRTASPNFGDVEVEGGEFIQLPDLSTQHIQGPSHAQGGVHTNLPEGSRVFSDHLKPKGGKKTYAQLAKKYDTEKWEKVLNNAYASEADRNTANLMFKRNQSILNELFADQQIQNGNSDGTDQAQEQMSQMPQMMGKFGLDLKRGEKLSFTDPFEYGGQYLGGTAEFGYGGMYQDGGMFPEDSMFYGATPGDTSVLTIGTKVQGKNNFQKGGKYEDIIYGEPEELGKEQVEAEAQAKLKAQSDAAILEGAPSNTNIPNSNNNLSQIKNFGLDVTTGFPSTAQVPYPTTSPIINPDAAAVTQDAGAPVTAPPKMSYEDWKATQPKNISNPKLQKMYKDYLSSIDNQTAAVESKDYSSMSGDQKRELFLNPDTPIDVKLDLIDYDFKNNEDNVLTDTEVADLPGNVLIDILNKFEQNSISYFGEKKDAPLWILRNPNMPAKVLREYAKKGDSKDKIAIAENPNAPVDVLKSLLEDEQYNKDEKYAKYDVLVNPNIPVDILQTYVKSKDVEARRGVATNLNTPESILLELSKDSDPQVRGYVGRNPSTPIEILNNLSKDSNPETLTWLATNPNITLNILKNTEKTLKDAERWYESYEDKLKELTAAEQASNLQTEAPPATTTTSTTETPGTTPTPEEIYGLKKVEKIKEAYSRDPKYKFRTEDLPQIKEELKVALKEWGIDTKENLEKVDKVNTLNGFTEVAEALQNKVYSSDPELATHYGINEASTLQGLQFLSNKDKISDAELNQITGGDATLKSKITSAQYGSYQNFSPEERQKITQGIKTLPKEKQDEYGKTNFMDKAWFFRRPIIKEVEFKDKKEYDDYVKNINVGGKYVGQEGEKRGLYIKPTYKEDGTKGDAPKKETTPAETVVYPGSQFAPNKPFQQMPSTPGRMPLYQMAPEALGYLSGLNTYNYYTPDYTHTEIAPPTLNIDPELQSIDDSLQSSIRQSTGNASLDASRKSALFNQALAAKQQAFARKQNFDAQARYQADQYNAQARDLESFRDVSSAAQVYNEYMAGAQDAAERERLSAITSIVNKKAQHDADEFRKIMYFTTMYPNYYYEGTDRLNPVKLNPYANADFYSKTTTKFPGQTTVKLPAAPPEQPQKQTKGPLFTIPVGPPSLPQAPRVSSGRPFYDVNPTGEDQMALPELTPQILPQVTPQMEDVQGLPEDFYPEQQKSSPMRYGGNIFKRK